MPKQKIYLLSLIYIEKQVLTNFVYIFKNGILTKLK
jgi:hypothetical protein